MYLFGIRCTVYAQVHPRISISNPLAENAESAAEVIASAPEIDMPQEWPDDAFAKLCYRMPDTRLLEIAVLREGDNLLLHWSPYDPEEATSSNTVHSTTIPAGAFFSDSQHAADAFAREKLGELVDKFAPGIDLVLQAGRKSSAERGSAAAGGSTSSAAAGNTQEAPPSRPPGTDAQPPALAPLLHPQQPRSAGAPCKPSCRA